MRETVSLKLRGFFKRGARSSGHSSTQPGMTATESARLSVMEAVEMMGAVNTTEVGEVR
jgi:hypothetical protein